MAKSVNKVILLGNVGKDPEIRSTPSGTIVATFGLATSDRFQDAQGAWQDRTEWHNLVAFKRTAEIIRDYVKKGSKLYIEGSLRTSNWDDKQSGQKRYKTEIIVSDLSLLSGREEGAGGYSKAASSASSAASFDQRTPPAGGAPDDYGQSAEISDDDIPF
jgi:single-strand DNA-binding protein